MLRMFQGKTFSGPIIQEDGAVYTPKGCRIHVVGTENPKEITKGTVITIVAVLLAIILLAALLAGKQPKDFPYEVELRNSIGQPLETAVLKAGIQLEDITEIEPGVYSSNRGFPIDGVAFDLYFYEDAGRLSGFAYIAEYQAEPKEAAKDIYNAAVNMRIKSFVQDPDSLNEEDKANLPELTRKNIRKHLEDENILLVKHTYDYTPSYLQDPIRIYMDSLEAMEDWEGRVGEYVVRKAVLYMDKGATYDPETQKVRLVRSYRIEPEREFKYD